jgi:hypothetical protein
VGKIIRSRLTSALIAIAGLMVAWVVTADPDPNVIPMILIDQDVSSVRAGTEKVDGRQEPREVFVIRDGSVISVFSKRVPGTGSQLVYCPTERFFVSPTDYSLFDRTGRYVAGPATRDMDEYKVVVDYDALEIRIGELQQRRRSDGEIPGAVAEKFFNWRADPSVPQAFCQQPVR